MRRLVYPGSFDPPTLGHLDVIRRGKALCDELVLAVLPNTQKSTLFALEERAEMLRLALQDMEGVRVLCYEGLTADLCSELKADALLHGLRDVKDFLYEAPIAEINRSLMGNLESVYLLSRPELAHLSSTLVRELAAFGKSYDHLVPAACIPILRKGFERAGFAVPEEEKNGSGRQ